MRATRTVPLLALWLALALPAAAQDPASKPCEGLRRTVAVNVLDGEGNQVLGLTVANFRGQFRGQPVRILSAAFDDRPRHIVILLDDSPSMSGGNARGRWPATLAAGQYVVSIMRRQDHLALAVFASRIETTVGFEESRARLSERFAALGGKQETASKAFRRTALLGSIQEALTLFGPLAPGSAILAITDGGENASRVKQRRVEEALLRSGVRLFFLYAPTPIPERAQPELILGARLPRDLADLSGGDLVELPNYMADSEGEVGKELGLALRALCLQIAASYRLEIELPGEVDKLRSWRLDVVGEQGKPMKGVTVVYAQKMSSCGTSDGQRTE